MVWSTVGSAIAIGLLAAGCLRAPIEGDWSGDTGDASDASDATGDADGPGMTGPILPTDDGADATTSEPAPACHPSYVPCLPVVDDLDCDEVRAMGAAPVDVVGEDAYGLDADHDGIGCET